MIKKYTIYGLVQGIGFRPGIKRIADRLGISGTVKNSGGVVSVTASGEISALEAFKKEIYRIPQSVITGITEEDTAQDAAIGFTIEESGGISEAVPMLTPDIATCDRCRSEFNDITNRRCHHPFISCTACGPRYSIMESIPYDRCNIAMADFDMCCECESEYTDISDNRCHAQTIACNDCGPTLKYTLDGDPLEAAAKTIKQGGVVAVKDIGGYHFACRADTEAAAESIRRKTLCSKRAAAIGTA